MSKILPQFPNTHIHDTSAVFNYSIILAVTTGQFWHILHFPVQMVTRADNSVYVKRLPHIQP